MTAPAVVAGVLYAMRARTLGRRLSPWRIVSFYSGLLLLVFAAVSPMDAVAEDGLFSVHMIQHVVIAEMAAPLIILGLTGPLLQPVLRYRWVRRLEVLTHPAVALPLWAGVLVFWHIPAMLDLALTNPVVHNVQHATFLLSGLILWAPVKEVLPAPRWFGSGWKALYLLGFWFVCLIMANVFWFSGTPFYSRYEETAPVWGTSALQDQANAGSVMMATAMLLVVPLLVMLFFRMARESEQRQRLIERGLDPEAVRRAVRYGRGEELARRADAEDRAAATR